MVWGLKIHLVKVSDIFQGIVGQNLGKPTFTNHIKLK